MTGQALSGARAVVDPTTGGWSVEFSLASAGSKDWNDMAAKIGQGGRVAVDLDGVVKSAPSLQTTNFPGKGQITGDFSQREAKDLALVLRYGSLPVELEPRRCRPSPPPSGEIRYVPASSPAPSGSPSWRCTWSPTTGPSAWWCGLAVTAAVVYPVVSVLGERSGLALTLAGPPV